MQDCATTLNIPKAYRSYQELYADELFHLTKERQLFLMEAQKAVLLPVTQWVKEQLQAEKIGPVRYIRSTTVYPNVDHISWFRSLEAGGGSFHGSGGYPVQYMLHLFDTEIHEAAGTALMNLNETDTQCDISLLLENQLQTNIFVSTHMNLPSEFILYGEKGKIVVPNFWKADTAQLHLDEEVHFSYQSEFVYEINHINGFCV